MPRMEDDELEDVTETSEAAKVEWWEKLGLSSDPTNSNYTHPDGSSFTVLGQSVGGSLSQAHPIKVRYTPAGETSRETEMSVEYFNQSTQVS